VLVKRLEWKAFPSLKTYNNNLLTGKFFEVIALQIEKSFKYS